jgi:hypothetical protein
MESEEVKPLDNDCPALAWLAGCATNTGPQIADRAREILRLGSYWGFAEWVAWGWAKRTRVTLLFGHGCVDLFDCFTPLHVAAEAATWSAHIHVIGCKVCQSGLVDYSINPIMSSINHFVYCWKDVHEEPRLSRSGSFLRDATTYASTSLAPVDLVDYYEKKGFVVIFTDAHGNCGPDAAAIHQGDPNTPLSWKHIRREVHDSMMFLRSESWFLDTFRACQEYGCDSHGAPATAPIAASIVSGAPSPAPDSAAAIHVVNLASASSSAPLVESQPLDAMPESVVNSGVQHDAVGAVSDCAAISDAVPATLSGPRHYSVPLKEIIHDRRPSRTDTSRVKARKIQPKRRNIRGSLSDRVRVGEKLLEFEHGYCVNK